MKREGTLDELARSYVDEGIRAFYDRKLNKAALSVQTALNLFKESGNMYDYTRNLNLIGVIYGTIGNETMAVDFYLEGLECAIEHQFYQMTILFYNNIGSRYMDLGEHEKAVTYFMKAAMELERDEVKTEERYNCWCMVTCMNLFQSFISLKQYQRAENAMVHLEELVQLEENAEYSFTYMISKYWFFWQTNRKELVYEKLDEILEGALNDANASDYEADMRSVCKLLGEMNEFERWRKIIEAFEVYTKEQGTVYFELALTEMWMEYYRKTGDMQTYIHLCVDHAELYHKQKVITDKERAAAIDVKIELQEKEAQRRRAEEKSNTDSLTDLGNRYMLDDDSCRIQKDCKEKNIPMAVGILDIDCFKEHNDTYGHLQGDDSLRKIADVLKDVTKDYGKAYRFGGDEYVVLLQNVTKESIEKMAKEIKQRIFELHIENKNSTVQPELTISQGYCVYIPQEIYNLEEVLAKADASLYQAKESGRNCFVIC